MRSIAVTEQSQVAEARREAAGLARALEFAEHDVERVALVATELATNLVRHAAGGELLISAGVAGGVRLVSLDSGPGMRDPEACRRDGYSTAGGSGTGLGAIGRIADRFDLWSRLGSGTTIVVHLLAGGSKQHANPVAGLEWDAVVQPKPGETACGDGWSAHVHSRGAAFLVSDGIGHGQLAADATAQAGRVFEKAGGDPPGECMRALHSALGGTRGAAAAVARVDLATREMTFCGIGNIAATVFHGDSVRRAVSQNGTLGHSVRKIQEFVYPFPQGAVLVMHSDGLTTSWDLRELDGLAGHAAATIAGVLHKRHRRGRDDAAVLVVKST